MRIDEVIEYTDSDGRSRCVVVGDLLDTEETEELLRHTAKEAGVAVFNGDYERDREDILVDLEGKIDDDDLACTLTGAIDADVSLYLTPLDLAVDAARQEAYDQAKNSLEVTIDWILAGRDESDIPVYDDNPDDLVGDWIYTGNPETGPRLCHRWHADIPAGATFDDQTFVTNSPDGDWGDVEADAIDLTPAQRKHLATWVANRVADEYVDRVERAAADITRQTLDARTGHWQRRKSEVVEQ